eukprot:829038-Prorocentrum_minimum.AAC.2
MLPNNTPPAIPPNISANSPTRPMIQPNSTNRSTLRISGTERFKCAASPRHPAASRRYFVSCSNQSRDRIEIRELTRPTHPLL